MNRMNRAVLALTVAVAFGAILAAIEAYDRSTFMALLLIHAVVLPTIAPSVIPERRLEAFRQAFTASLVVWMVVLLVFVL